MFEWHNTSVYFGPKMLHAHSTVTVDSWGNLVVHEEGERVTVYTVIENKGQNRFKVISPDGTFMTIKVGSAGCGCR